MAVNLLATARLNVGPYMKGLGQIQSGTAAVGATTAATGKTGQAAWVANERAAKSYTRGLAEGRKAQEQMGSAAKRSHSSIATSLSAQRYLMHDLSRQLTQYSALLAIPALATIGVAGMWEKSFADVERTLDPSFQKIERKVQALRTSLVSLSQALPISFREVTEIATLANQMGIASEQVADFTRAVAMFSATSGVSIDIAATAFGRLKSIMGERSIPFNEMADSILKVGVNSVATEAEIINITTQVSSIAAQAKFSTEEMIGLSGALASVRVPPELSRGLITRVFGQIDKAVSDGGSRLDTLARVSGRTADQFRKDWRSGGAATALNDFLKGIRDLGPQARKEIESLGITSVRDVPVLLRLANAADSEGNVGELLTQTMRDAQNASGETQRQYMIMADTVWAKLKVLGNNILTMFDAIGQSSLGWFGDTLDTMSKNLRNFTRDLDRPMEILGGIQLPWTNAEALGFITRLSLMVAGFTLLGSAVAKVGAAGVALRQLGLVMGGSALMGWLTGASGVAGASGAAAGITAVGTAAKKSRPILSSLTSGVVAAGASWRNLGVTSRTAAAGGLAVAANQLGKTAVANRALNTAMAGSLTAIPATTGALGNLVRFGLHPATLAIGAAVTAASIWANEFFGDTTDIKTFTNQLASIDTTNLHDLDNILSRLEVNGFWNFVSSPLFSEGSLQSVVKPFSNGVEGFHGLLDELNDIENMHQWWAGDLKPIGLARAAQIHQRNIRPQLQSLELVDQAVQNLADAGNGVKALELIQSLVRGGEDLETIMQYDEGQNIKSFVDQLFGSANIEQTTENLNALANGTLPELTDAMYGFAGATKIVNEVMDGDAEYTLAWIEAIDAANSAFINFGDSMSKATTLDDKGNFASFDISAFSQDMAASIDKQMQWQNDLITIAGDTTVGVVGKLAELGPGAADQISAIAEALKSEEPEVRQAGLDLMAQLQAGVEAGAVSFGTELGIIMSNQAWVRGKLDDSIFADWFTSNLTATELALFREAGENAGNDVVQGVADALANGKITFDEAIKMLEANEILVGVDLTKAMTSLSTFDAYTRGLITQVQIDALPQLAYNQLWQYVITANGETAFVKIDANTGQAVEDVAYVVDTAGNMTGTVPLDANDKAAIDTINTIPGIAAGTNATIQLGANAGPLLDVIRYYNGRTVATSYINVVSTHTSAGLYTGGGRMTQADGGVVDYYGNGGIRERHVAQIAPAGAMRVWAEPETGGEAYIPLSKTKRTRSMAILEDVANRFGYDLAAQNRQAIAYARGGFYELQARQSYARMRNNMAAYSGYGDKKEINFHFVNPVERDWAEDAWEKAQLVGGLL